MKKICLVFGIIFVFVNFVFAQDSFVPPIKHTESFVEVYLASFKSPNAYKLYREELEQMIFNKWTFENTGLRVGLVLKINKDGSFEEPEIYSSSDNSEFDKNAINTLKSLKQLKPLPENYPFPYAKAYITFSDNVKKHNDVDFNPYRQKLLKTIKSNWNPTKYNTSQIITVLFKIHKDGTITDAKIFYSAGIPDLDAAALQAVNSVSGKFPLPKEFSGKSIDVQFTFDYSVFSMNPVAPAVQKPVDEVYYENLNKSLVIVKKNLIREQNGYKYIHALKLNDFSYTAYLLKSKIDCKNRQIGVKRICTGTANMPYNVLGFTRLVNIFTDNVKMQSPDNNADYLNIYNYVCQP